MQNIIAIVFDFDDTLAPDSTSSFLESQGINVPSFWNEEIQALIQDDWDPIPAYLYKMIEYSNSGKIKPITREMLASFGRGLAFHDGVSRLFNRLRDHLKKINPRAEIEYYIISSGIGEILRNSKIARNFTDIWASDFAYNEKGEILFPKKVVSFTDKTRYLFQISKGIYGSASRGKPFEVNKKIERDRIRIPLDQFIYVGDGLTDIPCFSLVKKNHGIPIGVYDKHNRGKWGKAWGFIEEGRVSNLHSADYGANSDLTNSLMMAVENRAKHIELQNITYQG